MDESGREAGMAARAAEEAPAILAAAGVAAAAGLALGAAGAPAALAAAFGAALGAAFRASLGVAAGCAVARLGGFGAATPAPPSPAAVDQAPPPTLDALAPGLGRALLEQLPAGVLLIDEFGRVIFQNAAATDVVERSVAGLPYAAALRAPAMTEAVAAALADQRPADIDVTLQRAKERVIHAAIRPLPRAELSAPGADGEPPRPAVLIMLEDRTRAAKAEALRRDFVAYASHELKTPLASISGFIETLQGHAKSDPAATERFLRIMAQQTERMKRLVEDLLSLNRIEINEHVRPRDPVDLATVAWEVASALSPLAQAQGTRIEVSLPREGMMTRGSHDEVAQVFVNLMDNAVKYAGHGGPVRVTRAQPTPGRAGMIGVTVADSGPGIAREHLPRLTERFYRVDAARSRERGGTGLGLAIAKHILNRHRADLSVTSKLGEGSRFTVWFPATPDEAAAPEPPVGAAQ
ncbi:two-component system, OmpR family, phosphate regulon sensor histidine kinase PhoR [Rubrimonas cliftonensis]|uniref:histidine kinase n=2 Tax=Rubrimonas cliftonensis TaxID=89524 RepID=A0A1H3YVR5_9RHOB|nr:two-component system, OmpR family, phosphate regulon sensor histidine kinase PhoR [Rubrimonas cliftonensis]